MKKKNPNDIPCLKVVDLPEEELIVLHKNAKDLYDTYIKLGSVNFIKFDDDIIRDVGTIITQGHKSKKMKDIMFDIKIVLFRHSETEDDTPSVQSL